MSAKIKIQKEDFLKNVHWTVKDADSHTACVPNFLRSCGFEPERDSDLAVVGKVNHVSVTAEIAEVHAPTDTEGFYANSIWADVAVNVCSDEASIFWVYFPVLFCDVDGTIFACAESSDVRTDIGVLGALGGLKDDAPLSEQRDYICEGRGEGVQATGKTLKLLVKDATGGLTDWHLDLFYELLAEAGRRLLNENFSTAAIERVYSHYQGKPFRVYERFWTCLPRQADETAR